MGVIQVEKDIAEERMRTCLGCEFVRVYDNPNSVPDHANPKQVDVHSNPVSRVLHAVDNAMLWMLGIQCSVCKCGMNMKTKLNGASCPKGKWRR